MCISPAFPHIFLSIFFGAMYSHCHLHTQHAAPMVTYHASGEESGSNCITEVLYINLDTASQTMWAGDSLQDNKGRFVFMQVVYATSQSSMRPHISVRVFAKDVQDNTAPVVMVVQRKHVLYESVLDGASRVDRIIFGLQIANAGFGMTLHKKVLVGTCMYSRRVCVNLVCVFFCTFFM